MTREEIVKSMSLQDAIEVLKDTNTYGTADIAKSVAIETMRKYQKIEEIVDKWNEGIYDDEGLKDDSSSENLNKSEIPTGSTTKNDLPRCLCADTEITKSFIKDVEAVKDQLPCGEQMDFPKSFDEFVKDYGFRDKQEVYTNGSELIQVFRVKQWLEHISTTKNDLGVDCISRKLAIRELKESAEHHANDSREEALLRRDRDIIKALPPVTPQEPRKGHWTEEFNDLEGEVRFTCSSCGKYQLFGTDFCYHCGSDNREVVEE